MNKWKVTDVPRDRKRFRSSRMVRKRTARFVRNAKFLGRRSKQLLMVLADVIAMPAALWTAFVLRADTTGGSLDPSNWLYIASIAFTVPVFVRVGLYRAVIRFLGIRAA